MSGFYGYNPRDFRTDFSWLGDIGAAVSKAANAFPELWDLNQEIKENRFFKQKAYTEILEWIDWLDDTKVTNIASSMGLQYDPNDPQQARNLLKQQIVDPSKLSDKLSNEEYVKLLATDSLAPIIEAAKAKANGVLTEGDLFAGFKSGVTREAFKNYTTTGKAMMEDEQYQKTFNRRFGQDGELATELGIRNQSQLNAMKMEDKYNQERSQVVTDALDSIKTVYDPKKTPFENRIKMRDAALKYAKSYEMDDTQRKILLDEVDKEYRYLQEQANFEDEQRLKREKERNDRLEAERKALQAKRDKADPLVDQSDINSLYKDYEARIKQIDNRILMLRDDLATNNVKDKTATQNLIKSLESERDYLSSYLQDKQQLESGFQKATGLRGEDSRQSVLNREAFRVQQEGNLRRNKLMIDNSRDKVTAANNKFPTNPKKLSEVLDNDIKQERDLYQVVEVLKDGKPTGTYKISLRRDYKGLQKYLDNPNANVTVEDMIGKDVYRSKMESFGGVSEEEKDDGVDWAKVRRAKEVLAMPDSPDKPDLPRMKENAKKYLDSVGVQY